MRLWKFALFRKKASKQLVGLSEFVFLEDDKLIEILSQFFQFDLLLGRTQAEPAFGFACMPFLNGFGDP